jgi:acyl transferase domain-containing protein/acyl-CoA synthetase (AMP-forming)/AMP-acid ligase II/acyl carrier protein/NAD(P)-dependent dehydrogenase (short-subunit alcohol dehydrogenase family)
MIDQSSETDKFILLNDYLQHYSCLHPDKKAFSFLANGEEEEDCFSYRMLDDRAKAIAARLQEVKAEGTRVILLYPPGIEYVAALFGCLYAGAIAVPAYPPRKNSSAEHIKAITADSEAQFFLSDAQIHTNLLTDQSFSKLTAERWIISEDIASADADKYKPLTIDPLSIAFLQYTSGSTGRPKGVIVTHSNILHNERMIDQSFQHTQDSITVSWLPLFHDMGLIGTILQTIFCGGSGVIFSPAHFLQSPVRWLKAITKYRATTAGAPNFAYDLCVDKVNEAQLSELDLSSWSLAFNGSEPIRAETIKSFANKFSRAGFNLKNFYPCYGMAEATLLVSGGMKGHAPTIEQFDRRTLEQNRVEIIDQNSADQDGLNLVGCGGTWGDQRIVIANPETLTTQLENMVGEIWLTGSNVTAGYWNNSQLTEERFKAYLSDTGEGPFFRTGDLGFFKDGNLYITGRQKDLIIIRGKNHYPQDIERTVADCHEALLWGSGAAVGVDVDGREELVIIQEVKRRFIRNLDVATVCTTIRQAVAEKHGIGVYAIALVKIGGVTKTSSGKIRRGESRKRFLERALPIVGEWQLNGELIQDDPGTPGSSPEHGVAPGRVEIQNWLIKKLSEHTKIPDSLIDIHAPFERLGADSLLAAQLSQELSAWLNRKLSPTLLYDFPCINALAGYLGGQSTALTKTPDDSRFSQTEEDTVAIIGLSCRFPGAKNPEAFWELLKNGGSAIRPVPADRWNSESLLSQSADEKLAAIQWAGLVDDVAQFDPAFFGISPREAVDMDPQQRFLLEVSWEALESAGYATGQLAGTDTGVFIGISSNDYARLEANRNLLKHGPYWSTGNAFSIAANRLSYILDLRGPSLSIDTACSSSLVAIHHACQSLLRNECRMALAGGVNLILSPELSITFAKNGMLAPDGRCKTFDARANGYVRGEGCGIVALKRTSDALKDGDMIHAIIKGSAINQDGRSNGLTAPNGIAQEKVIRKAYQEARIHPSQVSLVEAHGTGTPLGDPIEFNSLGGVLSENRQEEEVCFIGSVKTNLGHLEAAAGVAGLIKIILALKFQVIPPHLHFKELNPEINTYRGLRIPTESVPWPSSGKKRIAGVSSFGFGGTNAHLVLEEYIQPQETHEDRPSDLSPHILTISARSEEALKELLGSYKNHLTFRSAESLETICHTANTARSHFEHRIALAPASVAQLVEQVGALDSGGKVDKVFKGVVNTQKAPPLAFVFAGQGSQYVNMGRTLYDSSRVFRDAMDQCSRALTGYIDKALLEDILYPADKEASPIDETRYTQPALFAFEYSLAMLWQSWGLFPDFVIGHSLGEYAAACVAGVFSLEDGLKMVAERGRLMQQLPEKGGMLNVFADEQSVLRIIEPFRETVSVAAVNSGNQTVVAGKVSALEKLQTVFHSEGLKTVPLTVSNAFHSALLIPMLDDFRAVAESLTYHQPKIPVVSNVSAGLAGDELAHPDYWCRHTLAAVRFADGIQELNRRGCEVFLEVGPKHTLTALGRTISPSSTWIPSLTAAGNDRESLGGALGQLYIKGININWPAVYKHSSPRKVELPTYPFQRQRYWINETPDQPRTFNSAGRHHHHSGHPLLGERIILAENDRAVFNARLDADNPSFLNDHSVYGEVVFPATGYIEMLLAAGKNILNTDQVTIEKLAIPQALLLTQKNPVLVQTSLSKESNGYAAKIYSLKEENDWVLHASCTVYRGEQKESASAEAPPLETLKLKFREKRSVEQFYQRYSEIGINYGPGFQAIRELWAGEESALSKIALPEALADGFQLHPVLLDAAFHTLAAAIPASPNGNAYLPVSIERFHFYRVPRKEVWSYVQYQQRGVGSTIEVDVRVMDASGRPVADIKKLELIEIQQHTLKSADDALKDWVYELEWVPQNEITAALHHLLPSPPLLQRQVNEYLEERGGAEDFSRYQEALRELEALTPDYIVHAFQEMGWDFVPGETFSPDEFIRHCRVAQAHHRFLSRLFEILEEEAIIARWGEQAWKVLRSLTPASPKEKIDEVQSRYSDIETEAALLHRFASRLGGILKGEIDPLHLLFQEDHLNGVSNLYERSLGARLMNGCLQEAFKQIVSNLRPEDPLSILEIGAGTGGSTSSVLSCLAELPSEHIEYLFTDISSGFFAKAKEKFSGSRFISYKTLDIENDPAAQGFEDGQYHVIIAANVLHATRSLNESVERIRRLLAPKGILLLLEGTTKSRWIDLIFGCTEGWWRFEDTKVRPRHPLISAEEWRRLLEAHQFETANYSQPGPKGEETVSVQSLIMAQANGQRSVESRKEHWLVMADQSGLGQELARLLAHEQRDCTLVYQKEGLTGLMRSQHGYGINPLNSQDFRVLFQEVSARSPVTNIVHLWSLDISREDGDFEAKMGAAQRAGCYSIIHLIKAIESALPKLFFVTRGSQPAGASPALNGLIQSPLMGMTKIVSLEHPLLKCKRIDLDASGSIENDARYLINELNSPSVEDQLAFRGEHRFVHRLVKKKAAPASGVTFDGERLYLITGGLGHVGMMTARWMVSKGARHLLLLNRSGATSSLVQQDLQNLKESGAEINVLCADTGSLPELANVFGWIQQTGRPLAGIIHAAGISGFVPVSEMEIEGLEAVFQAKVYGAWNLHHLTEGMNLDFFVCFSSASSVLGSRGYGHYAAANQFMDTLAHYRKGIGLPALSINWGLWAGGMVSSKDQRQLEQLGLRALVPDEAFRILESLIGQASGQVTIADVDWGLFKSIFQTNGPPPLFKQITVESGSSQAAYVLDEIKALPLRERYGRLKSHVHELVRKVLGYPSSEALDDQTGLFDIGIDSVTSIELIRQLQNSLGCSLPPTLIFKYPTIANLLDYLSDEVLLLGESKAEESRPSDTPLKAPTSPGDLDELSKDELAHLLARKLESIKIR